MQSSGRDNRGMIIVFTLILLAVFLTTALSFSYFIIGDINKARAVDDSVIAYYAADAGMEESLYLMKNQDLASSLDDLIGLRTNPLSRRLASSTGMWDVAESTSYEKSVLRQRLYSGQSVKFFILNRGAGSTPNQTKSITVNWTKGMDLSNAPTDAKLQVNLTQMNPQEQNGTKVYFTDKSKMEISEGTFCYDLGDLDLRGVQLNPLPDYVAEFIALGETDSDFIDQLTVKAYDKHCLDSDYADSYNSRGITNLTLKSRGTYGKATQNIVAHILPRDPVSGLLNFVLFSEQEVVKE